MLSGQNLCRISGQKALVTKQVLAPFGGTPWTIAAPIFVSFVSCMLSLVQIGSGLVNNSRKPHSVTAHVQSDLIHALGGTQ